MRRSLSPKERAAMLAEQDGLCAKCGIGIDLTGQSSVAEHWHMVALGNAQKPDCLLCVSCAHRKTNGTPATSYGSDSHAIAKVKRILKKLSGEKRAKQPFRTPPPGYKRQWPKRKVGE